MKKIWIVDDDEIYQFVMKTKIEKISNSVVLKSFMSGELFLEEVDKLIDATNNHPDIIFLDVNMPLMNGWEIIEKIIESKSLNLNSIKLYFSSSSIDSRDIEKARSFGCVSEYLLKPIGINKLEEIIN